MPNRRIKIALNISQSKCITVRNSLPGGPDEPYDVRDHIFTPARNKFRIMELSIIYRWGGDVVYDDEILPGDRRGTRKQRRGLYWTPSRTVEHTKTDGKVGEVSVPTSQSFVREDMSGPG